MNLRKLLPRRAAPRSRRERLVLVVLHLLRVAEAVLYLGTFTLYTVDWSTLLLFSDWADDA